MLDSLRIGALFCILACLVLLAPALRAQTLTSGDITGTVTDATGAAVPNAAVNATSRTTGAVQATKTNAQGYYHFAFLPPGQYRVEVSSPGFTTAQETEARVGQAVAVDIQLTVA